MTNCLDGRTPSKLFFGVFPKFSFAFQLVGWNGEGDAAAVLKVKGSFSFRNFIFVELFEDPEFWIFVFNFRFCCSHMFGWLSILSLGYSEIWP
jgi:hypothetical protein